MNNLKNMQYGSEIIIYLNNIKSEIELYNGFKLYNINKFAEYFYSEFLNLLFGYELEIMEKVNPNMVAIDLGDKNGEIAIQITSDISRGKVQETVEKYNKNGLNKIYKRLVVLHISNETPNYNKPYEIEQFNLKEDVWNIEYFLSNMPIENIDKLKKIRDFLKKYVEDSPQISNLDNFLKERYNNQSFTKLKPLSSLNKDVYIKDIYQDLSIIKKREKEDEKDEEIIIDRVLDNSKKVAILGKAGIGKSTLSKYICYQWANGQLFDDYEYLFYIPIRKWEKGEGIFDVVLKVLKESNNENIKIEADDLYEYIKNFNNATLFVIDGFDEIRNEDQEDIKKEIQNLNNYIITSRHDGLKKNELNIEETFENEGFNQKSIENFIGHIENSYELVTHINENIQLKELSKIPMLLDMICYLYKENEIDFNNDFTMTALYEKFLDEIILRFEEERESQSSKVTKEDDDIFFELGKIAFENLKDKSFKFKGTFITRSNRKFIENELLPFGFIVNLTNERHLKDREYEFIHTSFQEYFSALYVSQFESKEEQSKKIQESKFYPHMQMFFVFLGGLIKDEDKEFLLKEIKSKPRDIIGYYELLLLSICLSEMKDYDNQVFLNEINEKMIEWLDRLIKFSNEYYYEPKSYTIIFEQIKNNHYFHTQDVLNKLIEWMNKDGCDWTIHSAIAICFHQMSKSAFPFEEKIKPFLDKDKLDDFERIIIDGENNYKSTYRVHPFSYYPYNNKKEYEEDKIKTIKSLCKEPIKNDQEFKKSLFHILNRPFSSEIMNPKKNSMKALEKFFEVNDDDIISIALEQIKRQNEYLALNDGRTLLSHSISVLTSVQRDDDEFKDMLLKAIKDKKLDNFSKEEKNMSSFRKFTYMGTKIRNDISEKLFRINNNSSDFIQELLFIIDNGYIILTNSIIMKSVLKDSMTIEIFEKLFNYRFHGGEYLSETDNMNFQRNLTFLQGIKIEVLFQAYDRGYDLFPIMFSNLIHSNKPLYINQKNQLCTIENGKEISTSTEREVNEVTNEIKMMLRGEGLND